MKQRISAIVITLALTLAGCAYDKEDKLYPTNGTTSGSNCDTVNVTYTSQVQSVINSRCAITGCHVSGAQLPDLSTYSGAVNNQARIQVRALDQKTMPPSTANPLNACEMAKLQVWINNGTPQ